MCPKSTKTPQTHAISPLTGSIENTNLNYSQQANSFIEAAKGPFLRYLKADLSDTIKLDLSKKGQFQLFLGFINKQLQYVSDPKLKQVVIASLHRLTPDTTILKHKEAQPLHNITEDAAIHILKDILHSINIEQRYQQITTQSSLLNQFNLSTEPHNKQIESLREATQRATHEMAELLKIKKFQEESGTPMHQDEIENHVSNILLKIDTRIVEIQKNISNESDKYQNATSMNKMLASLRNEVELMMESIRFTHTSRIFR